MDVRIWRKTAVSAFASLGHAPASGEDEAVLIVFLGSGHPIPAATGYALQAPVMTAMGESVACPADTQNSYGEPSRISAATTTPERNVRAATDAIAAPRPKRSAISPAMSAPIA